MYIWKTKRSVLVIINLRCDSVKITQISLNLTRDYRQKMNIYNVVEAFWYGTKKSQKTVFSE